jgi:hypothetical protein
MGMTRRTAYDLHTHADTAEDQCKSMEDEEGFAWRQALPVMCAALAVRSHTRRNTYMDTKDQRAQYMQIKQRAASLHRISLLRQSLDTPSSLHAQAHAWWGQGAWWLRGGSDVQ